MEIFFTTLLCLFLSLVFLTLHYLFYKSKTTSLPPGRTGWPLLGETLEFLSTGRKGHPEKFILYRMAKYSPTIFRTHLLGDPAAVFCGPASNKFLFSNENKLVQVWWPKSINKIFPSTTQLSSSKEESIKMRKMLPNFFKAEALRQYVGVMDRIARRHFADRWEGKDEVVVYPLTKEFTFRIASSVFLSIQDPHQVRELSDPFNLIGAGLFSVPINLPGTPFNRGIKASNTVRKMLLSIIKRRKLELADGTASPTQDILSHMLLTCDDENSKSMEEWEIADKILGLLIGGHDSSGTVCTFVIKFLAELPHVYDGVYREQMEILKSKSPDEALNWEDLQKMKYSWNVACEVIRVVPPLQGTFREALVDFMYNGYSIPKGWKLYWNAHSTHKNPEYFPDPEKFDPSRFEGSGPAPYTYVPFGGGPRMCPGREFARLEILVFMHHLVKRYKWEKIIPDEKTTVDPLPMPIKGLPIRLYCC